VQQGRQLQCTSWGVLRAAVVTGTHQGRRRQQQPLPPPSPAPTPVPKQVPSSAVAAAAAAAAGAAMNAAGIVCCSRLCLCLCLCLWCCCCLCVGLLGAAAGADGGAWDLSHATAAAASRLPFRLLKPPAVPLMGPTSSTAISSTSAPAAHAVGRSYGSKSADVAACAWGVTPRGCGARGTKGDDTNSAGDSPCCRPYCCCCRLR
jgi:hypothetical protein